MLTKGPRGRSRLFPWRSRATASIADVRQAESLAANLGDAAIRDTAVECRSQVHDNGPDSLITRQYCGLIAESIYRTHGFRLHDCQVQALSAGDSGVILEMQTGEGKTIVTGAIAALQLLSNATAHVSTTNDYLAERDLSEMREVFERLGLTWALLPVESNEAESRRAYRAQVVYGPGYQFGFDYLRDQMFLRQERPGGLGRGIVDRLRQRDPYAKLIQPGEFHVAIVDEADSVMIDEAMTPLIISLPSGETEDPRAYEIARRITEKFEEGVHYTTEPPRNRITVTDEGNERAHEAIIGERDLTLVRPWRIYIANALRAREQFERDVQYVVVDQEVQLVDQNTGRIQPDRRWQDGLHQAIECQERVPIQAGRESTAQVTRQRFLQRYTKLIGLTGTAASATTEFRETYNCRVQLVPTNRPCLRRLMPTRFFGSNEAKLAAIAADTADRHANGQPVLVGTKTIRESHEVRDALVARGLTPVVLNGIQDEEEADIIARAGHAGAITIATNMAGRGTDIKPDAAGLEAGGLHVAGVSINDSPRIDRQLAGRAARQGQPGSCQFFLSADDSILVDSQAALADRLRRSAKSNGEARDFSGALKKLQAAIESRNHRARQTMMKRDRWMDTVREAIEKE